MIEGSRVDAVLCRKCKMAYKEHVGDERKCLFEASTFGAPEELRIALMRDTNSARLEREDLESLYGEVLDTIQLTNKYQVRGFLAPFVNVTRKSDNANGMMTFQHMPRYYWGFEIV